MKLRFQNEIALLKIYTGLGLYIFLKSWQKSIDQHVNCIQFGNRPLLPLFPHHKMVSTAEKEKSVMKWTVADEATLLQTLHGEKANGSWGDNPKPSAYTACELALV
jgi:hypothetical protein